MLGLADRMAGEQIACPRCAQRLLVPAGLRPVEKPLTASGPPPVPRQSIFPDFPVMLEAPGLDVRLAINEPESPTREPKPWTARWVGFFLILGGLWGFGHPIAFAILSNGLCCLWLPMFVEPIWGVVALVRGVQILTAKSKPRAPVILVLIQIHLCLGFDMINTFLGVLNILMLCAPKSRAYFRREWE